MTRRSAIRCATLSSEFLCGVGVVRCGASARCGWRQADLESRRAPGLAANRDHAADIVYVAPDEGEPGPMVLLPGHMRQRREFGFEDELEHLAIAERHGG